MTRVGWHAQTPWDGRGSGPLFARLPWDARVDIRFSTPFEAQGVPLGRHLKAQGGYHMPAGPQGQITFFVALMDVRAAQP